VSPRNSVLAVLGRVRPAFSSDSTIVDFTVQSIGALRPTEMRVNAHGVWASVRRICPGVTYDVTATPALRAEAFRNLWALISDDPPYENLDLLPRAAIPYMDEPWYC
jgi:hypothetical protein